MENDPRLDKANGEPEMIPLQDVISIVEDHWWHGSLLDVKLALVSLADARAEP